MSETATIALVRDLARALRDEGVSYCHFKSNAFLDRTRTGENDLDLLVAREDEAAFSAILHRLGFKLALRTAGALPGVLDYYGYDADADRIVHVHAHYQLIAGDDLTKNYVIPLEAPFLTEAIWDGDLRVPPPELELILLVLRLVIKHATWDAIALHRGAIPKSARAELAWLEERADDARRRAALERWLPRVDETTYHACRRAVEPGAPAAAGVDAGRRLIPALAPYARRSRAGDLALMTARRVRGIVEYRVLRRPAPRKRLVAGGAFIALIGADGAGKSTAIEALETWLGRTFPVTRVHLGRPPESATTTVLRTLARARSLGRKLAGRTLPPLATEHAVLGVAVARDRYRLFRDARRLTTEGGIVVSDRFPLPQLPTMDAPRVERFAHPDRYRWLVRRLAAMERRYYAAITEPDLLIVLRVTPEVALARRPEDPPEYIRERWAEIWAVDWEALGAHVIDAGAPREDVEARLKAIIWPAI